MSRRQRRLNDAEKQETNIFDVLTALINGIFNLFRIEKIICIVALYLVGRDWYLASKIENFTQGKEFIIGKEVLEKILTNDNKLIIILLVIIAILIAFVAGLIKFVIPIYKNEIDRLAEERKDLLHGTYNSDFEPLRRHHSTEAI